MSSQLDTSESKTQMVGKMRAECAPRKELEDANGVQVLTASQLEVSDVAESLPAQKDSVQVQAECAPLQDANAVPDLTVSQCEVSGITENIAVQSTAVQVQTGSALTIVQNDSLKESADCAPLGDIERDPDATLHQVEVSGIPEQQERRAVPQTSVQSHTRKLLAEVGTSKQKTNTSTAACPAGKLVDATYVAPSDKSGPSLPLEKRGLRSPEESPARKSPTSDDLEDAQQGAPEGSQKKSGYKSHRLAALAKQDEDVDTDCLTRIVNSIWFEVVTVSLILLNCLSMAAEAQFVGYNVGYDLGYPKYSTSPDDQYPWIQATFNTMPIIFTCMFLAEWLLRIAAYKNNCFRHPMLAFDIIVIVVSGADVVAHGMFSGVNPTVIRLIRVVKLIRIIKLLRHISWMSSLYLLVRSIIASFNALLWALTILILLQTSVCLGLLQILYIFVQDNSQDLDKRRSVFEYFGTFTRGMVTMFEISVGNWVPVCRLLMEDVSEWFGLFFILYTCSLCFAVVNVIRAVFIAETGRIAAGDDEIAMMRKEQNREILAEKLRDIFEELDDSGDGVVSRQEFNQLITDTVMHKYLSSLDVDVHDMKVLFKILDDGDGTISCEEFCKGVVTVKGQAKAIDMIRVEKCVQRIEKKVDTASRIYEQFESKAR